MTNEHIKSVERKIHNLKLSFVGRPNPQTEALANQIDDLIHEVQRLRDLVCKATRYLKDYDPETAQRLSRQVDWSPKGPI